MQSPTPPAPVSKKILWTSYIMSGLPVLMLLASAALKLAHPPKLDEGFVHLGIPVSHALGLGILELACALIYAIPRTSVLGAILLTGYLGGAMLTHLRIGEPYFSQIILGIVIWGGLYLREPRLRALIPLRS